MVHSSFGERLEKRTPFIWLCQSPSNPLSHDERFLNCWIRDCSFSLDCIKDCLAMLVLVITKPLLTTRVSMTTSFSTPLIILSSGSNGKVGILSILPCRLGGRQAPTSIIQ